MQGRSSHGGRFSEGWVTTRGGREADYRPEQAEAYVVVRLGLRCVCAADFLGQGMLCESSLGVIDQIYRLGCSNNGETSIGAGEFSTEELL